MFSPSFDSCIEGSVGVLTNFNDLRVILEVFPELTRLGGAPCGLLVNYRRDSEHIFSAVFAIVRLFLEPLAK